MGPQEASVAGMVELLKLVDELKGDVFVLFCGGKDAQGQSWCPDCVAAEPVIAAAAAEKLDESATLIHCDVGGREAWKAPDNAFRTHAELKLTGVPTLLKWEAPEKKLVEAQCLNKDLVELLFEDC